MRHNVFGITDKNCNLVFFNSDFSSASNSPEVKRMKKMLMEILLGELTSRQRECIVMYYYENRKIDDIAKSLSVCKSTVSRHIKAGEKKLKNVAKYY